MITCNVAHVSSWCTLFFPSQHLGPSMHPHHNDSLQACACITHCCCEISVQLLQGLPFVSGTMANILCHLAGGCNDCIGDSQGPRESSVPGGWIAIIIYSFHHFIVRCRAWRTSSLLTNLRYCSSGTPLLGCCMPLAYPVHLLQAASLAERPPPRQHKHCRLRSCRPMITVHMEKLHQLHAAFFLMISMPQEDGLHTWDCQERQLTEVDFTMKGKYVVR